MYQYKEHGRSIRLKKVLAGCLLVAGLAFFGSVQAIPVVSTDGNVATGITNLDINGQLYDVEFSAWDTYDNVFAARTPTFLGDETGARDALVAVHAVLNNYNATKDPMDPVLTEVGVGSAENEDADNNWLVPYALSGSDVTSAGGNYGFFPTDNKQWSSHPPTSPGYSFTIGTDEETHPYATFDAVPVPSAVLLFLSGILMFGFVARRKFAA